MRNRWQLGAVLSVVAGVVGCSSGGGTYYAPVDLSSVGSELGASLPDLGGFPRADLASSCLSGYTACPGGCADLQGDAQNCGACGHACGGGLVCIASQCSAGTTLQFAMSAIALPRQRTDHAWDLNGDGRVDNQYGNIIGALVAQNFDPQSAADQQVQTGALLNLLSVTTSDPALTNDPSPIVTLSAGQVLAGGGAPKFDGTDRFAVDNSVTPATLRGALTARQYRSEDPATARVQVSFLLPLPGLAFLSTTPVSVTLHGLHLSFSAGGGGGLGGGALQGGIRMDDIRDSVLPAVAMQLNLAVQQDPTSSSSKQVLAIFDQGGCTNPDGSQAFAGDDQIDVCEVATNALIQNVLAPDVQLYSDSTVDATGKVTIGHVWGPQKANQAKDCLSVGLGFTAVPASY